MGDYKHKYKLLYRILSKGPDGIDAEEVPEGFGACDAIFMASIIYPPDGSLSQMYVGLDGRKPPVDGEGTPAELDDVEWFKVWALLSARLAKSRTLSEEKRAFAALVFETFCKSIEAADAAQKQASAIAASVGLRDAERAEAKARTAARSSKRRR